MRLGHFGGLQLGGPTGGDKGTGTLNVATDIYKNDTAYTNPDYVFELAYLNKAVNIREGYEGVLPLREVEQFAQEHYYLPGVSREASGIFERGDIVLEKVEEAYLYLFDHESRIEALERKQDARG